MNYFKFLFFVSLVYLSLVGWCSNNWLTIWLIMEIMFLFFMGVMTINMNYNLVELVAKYFIIQVFVSLMLLSLLIFFLFCLSLESSIFIMIVLSMKLGLFPFHFWLIMILGKLDWLTFLFMLTFMKLLPLLLIYYIADLLNFTLILMSSILMGSILGLNNTLIQKIFGYSSMIHLCWLFISLMASFKIFLFYFFIYLVNILITIGLFNSMNAYFVNQFKIFTKGYIDKFLFFFVVLSMSGFPPFVGFLGKWLVINLVLFLNFKVLVFFLLFFSLFSCLFYLQLFYYLMLFSSLTTKWYNYNLSWNLFNFFIFSVGFSYLLVAFLM